MGSLADSGGRRAERPPPPGYWQRYPEGRERLLALADSRLAKSPSAISAMAPLPPGTRQPKMGVRGRPTPEPSLSGRSGVYASEASLPDKLSQALRGLATPFRNHAPPSAGAVAADDVVFYSGGSGAGRPAAPRYDDVSQSQESLSAAAGLEEVMAALRSPNTPLSSVKAPPPPVPPKTGLGLNSLDQLRQLYKSMPDCSSLGRGVEHTPRSTTKLIVNGESERDPSPYSNVESYRLQLQSTADKMLSPQRPPPPVFDSQQRQRGIVKPIGRPPKAPTRDPQDELPPPPPPPPERGGDSPTDSGYRSVPRHLQEDSPKLSLSPPESHSTPLKAFGAEAGGAKSFDSLDRLNDSATAPLSVVAHETNGSLVDALSCLSSPTSFENGLASSTRSSTDSAPKAHGSHGKRGARALGQSFETINTNVSLPEEFSLDRVPKLVEPERVPWTEKDVVNVLQKGRTKELVSGIAVEVVPRLAYLLRRPLVRLARELGRLAARFGKATKRDAQFAAKMVLCGPLAASCERAGQTATALFAMSGGCTRQSKAQRAGLRLPVGKLHRWLLDAQVCPVVLDQAAVFLTAVLECVLEELVMAAAPPRDLKGTFDQGMLTSEVLEAAVAGSGSFWGLLQPYEHLINARTAGGVLCLPDARLGLEQSLLATCVGSQEELGELITRVGEESEVPQSGSCLSLAPSVASHSSGSAASAKGWPRWSGEAVRSLYYYMRCSQLEHGKEPKALLLSHERPYLVLPPLVEYLRVAVASAAHRLSPEVQPDDVTQAARLLLPGLDVPPLPFRELSPASAASATANGRKAALGFALLASGRPELVPEAAELLGPRRLNALNPQGLTPLMLAVLSGSRERVRLLLESGADMGLPVPPKADANTPLLLSELAGWTALTFAVASGSLSLAQLLLEKGADVELPAMRSETPLQLAAAMGHPELVSLLLRCGADPYLGTFSPEGEFRQQGSAPPIALAASHGHRSILQLMIRRGQRGRADESLSLADFLADDGGAPEARTSQLRQLQEALYHAAEAGHSDVALDLRNMGVPWSLAAWAQTLGVSVDGRRKTLTQRLLSDFLSEERLAEELSPEFLEDGLPLLLEILGNARSDAVLSQCAAVLQRLYGTQPPAPLADQGKGPQSPFSARIEASYVNNVELSDVRFLLQGRTFFAHRIVLANAGPRLKGLMAAHASSPSAAIPVEDITYEVFEVMMGFLYRGSLGEGRLPTPTLLQLLAAATEFGLDGLKSLCASRISASLCLDNCLEIYRYARNLGSGCAGLVEYCEAFFLQHLPDFVAVAEEPKPAADAFRKYLRSRRGNALCSGLLNVLTQRLEERMKK